MSAGALFDTDALRVVRHPYEPDEGGRCKRCGALSDGADKTHSPGLADKFLVPPFSVLDTRQDYWQTRRRSWLSLGIRGETGPSSGAFNPDQESRLVTTAEARDVRLRDGIGLGRKEGLIYQHDAPASDPSFYDKKRALEKELGTVLTTEAFKRDYYRRDEQDLGASQSIQTGTSVFDPVLCEIAVRWFSGPGARVIDPFAGGVVRGLVAGALGRSYTGIELRPEQIADNREQATQLLGPGAGIDWGGETQMPQWIEADATKIAGLYLDPADLVFTCPPYADLERYSDDPRDLSTMPYEQFRVSLASVMAQTAALLREDRFAVWVVGEARGGSKTAEYGLVADTVKAAQAAGMVLYNSGILVNSVGSAALRAQMILRTRKLTRVHQHVLVFLNGDHKRAAAACGSAELD
jgi:DNA modification methylase